MAAPKKQATKTKSTPGTDPAKSEQPHLSPDVLPILLRDSQKRIVAGIKLETLTLKRSVLKLTGWTIGSPQLTVLCNGVPIPTEIKRIPRKDVMQNLSTVCGFDPGFEIVANVPRRGTFMLRWHLDLQGRRKPVDFRLDVKLDADAIAEESQESLLVRSPPRREEAEEKQISDLDCAFRLGHGVVVIGRVEDQKFATSKLFIHRNKTTSESFALVDDTNCRASQFSRQNVNGVADASSDQHPRHGLLAWVPFDTKGLEKLNAGLGKAFNETTSLPLLRQDEYNPSLENLLEFCGYQLAALANDLRDESWLIWLEGRGYSLQDPSEMKCGAVDQAYNVNGRALLLHGWVAAGTADIHTLTLVSGQQSLKLEPHIKRLYRPDLFAAYPHLTEHSLGFVALIEEAEFVTLDPLKLVMRTETNRTVASFNPMPSDMTGLFNLIAMTPAAQQPVAELIGSSRAIQSLPGFAPRYQQFLRSSFRARLPNLPTSIHDALLLHAAVDRVFNLEANGLILLGWYFATTRKIRSVSLQGPDGKVADLTKSLFPLIRLDVSNSLRSKFAGITDYCGFCCHIPSSTNPGDPRALLFSLEGEVDVMLRVECGKLETNYSDLLQAVYSYIPHADRYSNNLFALYDKVMGAPLRAIVAHHRNLQKVGMPVQIGAAVANPAVSLVASFADTVAMRQFLCHFAADKEIGSTEIVCVVAKPVHTNEFLATAHYCSRLFDVSLVLVFTKESLDSAEATNIGASLASAPLLVLADEGVIPCSDTLLGRLKEHLEGSNAPAAVCPLPLLFDSSALHYGLQVSSSSELPGFTTVRPRHTQPANLSGLVPSEALSKACVAIRKSDFDAAGGLDTSFLHADFAWDSLSTRLAAGGKTMMVDLDNALWQRNPGTTPKAGVRSLRDFTYYLDAWAYTGNLQHNNRNSSH